VASGDGWLRIHAACSVIAWWGALNVLWIIFTLLGGVVLGIGPATVTACILSRRRMRDEPVRLRDFAATWRAELLRGTAVILPALVVVGILLSNYVYFAGLGPAGTVPRLITLAAFVLAVGVAAYLGPMYAHYDVPLRSYPRHATRFALGRPASTFVLLFVLAVIAFATAAWPVLLFTVSIGAALQVSTWLCVRWFEENEDRLADADPPGPPVRILPAEPLQIR
jgi:uncharacterized membrane protein YesL